MDLESHADLMNKLFESHSRAVPDGPVDPVRYAKASPRILWILREVHDQDATRWRLNEFLNLDEQFETYPRRWSTYGFVAKASQALLKRWRELATGPAEDARDALRDIAVINLKKVGGGSSIDGQFGAQTADWLPYLSQQLDLLEPEIVICGGSYDFLPTSLAPRIENFTSATKNEQRYWIRLSHPGQRTVTQATMYSELANSLARLGWDGFQTER